MAGKNTVGAIQMLLENDQRILLEQQQEIQKRLLTLGMAQQALAKIQKAITLCEESERQDGVNTLRSYIDRIQSVLEHWD